LTRQACRETLCRREEPPIPDPESDPYEAAELYAADVRARDGDLTPVFDALERAYAGYIEAGGSPDEVIPGPAEVALGFRRKRPDGKTLWQTYADLIREELCDPKGELHDKVGTGLKTSGATLVTMLIAVLGLPLAAAPLIAPVAGSVLGLGVDAFCRYAAERE
jgi:hypothetical protein